MEYLLSEISTDDELQVRVDLDVERVARYTDEMREGALFPPIVLFEVEEGRSLVADGWHRIAAAKLAGLERIAGYARQGSLIEGLAFATAVNASEGLRLKQSDKRKAIFKLLDRDPAWREWSSRKIANRLGFDDKTVEKYRQQWERENSHLRNSADGEEMAVPALCSRLYERGGKVLRQTTKRSPKSTSSMADSLAQVATGAVQAYNQMYGPSDDECGDCHQDWGSNPRCETCCAASTTNSSASSPEDGEDDAPTVSGEPASFERAAYNSLIELSEMTSTDARAVAALFELDEADQRLFQLGRLPVWIRDVIDALKARFEQNQETP